MTPVDPDRFVSAAGGGFHLVSPFVWDAAEGRRKRNPEWESAPFERHFTTKLIEPRPCAGCGGSGIDVAKGHRSDWWSCPACGGTGKTPVSSG